MLSWRLNRRNIFPDKDIIKRYIQSVLVTGFLLGSAEVDIFFIFCSHEMMKLKTQLASRENFMSNLQKLLLESKR